MQILSSNGKLTCLLNRMGDTSKSLGTLVVCILGQSPLISRNKPSKPELRLLVSYLPLNQQKTKISRCWIFEQRKCPKDTGEIIYGFFSGLCLMVADAPRVKVQQKPCSPSIQILLRRVADTPPQNWSKYKKVVFTQDMVYIRALRYYHIGIKNSILLFKSIVSVSYRYRNSRF